MKILILFSLVAASLVGMCAVQRQKLTVLRDEAAVLLSAHARKNADFQARSSERGLQNAERWIESGLTRAGYDKLPHIRQLLSDRIESQPSRNYLAVRNARKESERVGELLAELGALAFADLLRDLEGSIDEAMIDQAKSELWRRYAMMNPPQAFLLLQERSESPERENLAAGAFASWGRMDPAGALRWFIHAEADPNSFLPSGIRDTAIAIRARSDPGRAIASTIERIRSEPDRPLPNSLYSELRGNSEHLAFLSALRRTEEKEGDRDVALGIRDSYVSLLCQSLAREDFEIATELIDGGFTAKEKIKFAQSLSSRGGLDAPGNWARWLMKLGIPAEESHPLVGMARANDDGPAWLPQLPAGELRDLAVTSSIQHSDPIEAATLIKLLPVGPKRTELGLRIANRWAKTNPHAAAEFLRQEGALQSAE
jgi:hypothetical protein